MASHSELPALEVGIPRHGLASDKSPTESTQAEKKSHRVSIEDTGMETSLVVPTGYTQVERTSHIVPTCHPNPRKKTNCKEFAPLPLSNLTVSLPSHKLGSLASLTSHKLVEWLYGPQALPASHPLGAQQPTSTHIKYQHAASWLNCVQVRVGGVRLLEWERGGPEACVRTLMACCSHLLRPGAEEELTALGGELLYEVLTQLPTQATAPYQPQVWLPC
jgi:hypothetical protein